MIRKVLALFLFFAAFASVSATAQAQQVVQDSIVGNVHWTADKTYLLRGYVYIVNGATLTIDPGTLIFGEKETKGTLIAERGGKLIARGTQQRPIIFTSQQPFGQRDRGDWGGVILCGRAPINQNSTTNGGNFAGGDAQIEGGPRTHYGGTSEHDNSGVVSYVRIEFPGVALSPNNEINGLTFGGVGDSTQIDHVQVSYSGDDNYEWFGGSVNAKYLVGFRGLDDEWDTDFGFHGKLQFCLSIRDQFVADISQSNGFESDNDNPPNYWSPRTSALASNMTVIGPMADTSTPHSPLYGRAAHLRRSTEFSIYNSVLAGWPVGVYIDGDATALAAKNDTLQVRNTIVAGYGAQVATTNASAGTGFDPMAWFNTQSYGNRSYVQPASVGLTNPFNIDNPDPTPNANSVALNGASFNNPRLQDPFFTNVNYVGAFGPGPRWDAGWTNYDPVHTNYGPVYQAINAIDFGKVLLGQSKDVSAIVLRNTGVAPITIVNSFVSDTSKFKITQGSGTYTILAGDSALFFLRYTPKDTAGDNRTLKLALSNGDTVTVALTAKGASKPGLSLQDTTLNFAYVNLNDKPTKDLIITNTGNETLQISNVAITGADASSFSIVKGGSDQTVAANGKAIITVQFMPTVLGAKNATLTFTTNAKSTPVTVPLTGTGIKVYGQDILKDSITGNVTLTNDRTWLLRGFVYVVNGATLNIQPGTVVIGEKATKGTLVVEPGGKLFAIGTPTKPIVFTSQQPMGQRDRGDWGGVVLCGRAPINQNNTINGGNFPGGDAQIEGGPRTHYGGTNEHDNSGTLRYVRIEFPGVALSPNNEINGLTFGGVGDSTQIDHIQVSYSGDDNYEWFGGSVNAKYLIGFRGLDDEWDTDFGFHGKLQFCFSLRDPQIADVSQSNGFESDNDNPPNYWLPRTAATISNLTVVGPQRDTGATFNPLFGRGAHLRRSTEFSIYNSIIMGWPTAILFDGDAVVKAAKNDTLQIRNTIVAGLRKGSEFATNVSGFDPAAWFRTPSYGNLDFVQPSSVKLADPFNLAAPNAQPMSGSPASSGASFDNPRLQNQFFNSVNYRGAFDPNAPRWDSIWANYDPQNVDYSPKPVVNITNVNFGQVLINTSKDSTVTAVITNNGNTPLTVKSVTLSNGTDFSLIDNLSTGFVLEQHDSKSIRIHFAPTTGGVKTQTITFTYNDEQTGTVTLTGEGVTDGVAMASSAPAFALSQNVPNPFSRSTQIKYELIKGGAVRMDVYDAAGRVVANLVNEHQVAGTHSATFDASTLPQGVYYYRLSVNGESLTRHMVVTR